MNLTQKDIEDLRRILKATSIQGSQAWRIVELDQKLALLTPQPERKASAVEAFDKSYNTAE
jgi:hypothetical protein